MLDLQSGQRVLDVGCGIGGGDFYMAAQHDVFVHGIDLSVNMVLLALERAAGMSNGGKVGAKGGCRQCCVRTFGGFCLCTLTRASQQRSYSTMV